LDFLEQNCALFVPLLLFPHLLPIIPPKNGRIIQSSIPSEKPVSGKFLQKNPS